MDIAKLRKKFKESAASEAEKPDVGREEVTETKGTARPEVQSAEEQVESKETSEGEEPTVQLLAFRLANEEYAFRIDEIDEIVRPQRITKIPNTRPSLLGITSLRGKIIPVVDLRRMFSLGEAPEGADRKQKILILKGPKGPVGALIDSVTGVIRPLLSKIAETPIHLREDQMRFIEGVAIVDGRFISVIRMEEAVAIET